MALSLNRSSSRMVCACLLASLLLFASASATETDNPQPPAAPEPIFVIQAKVDTAHDPRPEDPTDDTPHDDWKPDVTDLERSLAATLSAWQVRNVSPATGPIPDPTTPNVYLLELTVEGLYTAERDLWHDDADRFDPCRAVGAELSLKVIHLGSGRLVSDTSERTEYCSTDSESKELDAQRGAVYIAVENLSQRFVEAWAAGRFEQDLKATQAPSTSDRLLHTLNMYGMTVPGIASAWILMLLLFLYIWFAFSYRRQVRELNKAWVRVTQSEAALASKQRAVHHEWDQELQEAFALSFETNGFDDAACEAVAAARLDELLASHASIEAKEAERVVSTKVRASELEKIAAYAISRCDLDKNDVIETLRRAEEWPYRVLQEAKRLAVEVAQNV